MASGSMKDMSQHMKKKSSVIKNTNLLPQPVQPTAPGSAAPGSSAQISYDGNLDEVSPAPPQNPEKGGPTAKVCDTLYPGE